MSNWSMFIDCLSYIIRQIDSQVLLHIPLQGFVTNEYKVKGFLKTFNKHIIYSLNFFELFVLMYNEAMIWIQYNEIKTRFVKLLWPPNKLKGEYKLNHMKMIREAKRLEKEEPPLAKLMQSTQQAAIQLTIMAKRNE